MLKYTLDRNFNQITETGTDNIEYYKVTYSQKTGALVAHKFIRERKYELTNKERDKLRSVFNELSEADFVYLEELQEVLDTGIKKVDRTGVGTISKFGSQNRYDLSKGFPLLTTKKMNIRNIVSELLWFIKGDTNIRYLLEYNNPIWTDWAFEKYVKSVDYKGNLNPLENLNFADPEVYKKEIKEFEQKILLDDEFANKYGELGSVYGKQWRDFGGVDQLQQLITDLKENPHSRRLILSAWNVPELPSMALPPCHLLVQFYVNPENNTLNCQLYQRSMDKPLGEPYNIASYAILVHLLALECGYNVGEFIHTGGDTHIYTNQVEGVLKQLERLPYKTPKLKINNFTSIFNVKPEDIEVTDYECHNFIKFPIAK